MPAAVSIFLETPRKGQIPRNWLSTTLLTSAEPTAIISNSFISYLPPIPFPDLSGTRVRRIRRMKHIRLHSIPAL